MPFSRSGLLRQEEEEAEGQRQQEEVEGQQVLRAAQLTILTVTSSWIGSAEVQEDICFIQLEQFQAGML